MEVINPQQEVFSLPAFSPGGEKAMINVDKRMQSVKELKLKAVEALPWTPGQHLDNVLLIIDGKTLDESTPLSKCNFLPKSTLHLALKVHGG